MATFCHNISRGLPIEIHNENSLLKLVYIDDLIDSIIRHLDSEIDKGYSINEISPIYEISLTELAKILGEFESSQDSLQIGCVGNGLTRALYSTYLIHKK